ncbi:MAG: single-stranded DNA-binding protein [Clostridiales bacterium]|nr:single-stranded DNA-binding protein [Clostridiales bacterium]
MNQVVLIGRLTRDPELRYIPGSGTPVTRFSIAVARQFKKEGQPDADFFNIVVWGKPAESAAQYLVKGRLVAVNGNMRNNNYEDKNGVKHYNIEIVASRIEFLEWATNTNNKSQQSQNSSQYQNNQQKSQGYQQNNNHQQNQPSYQQDYSGFQAIDDDIPF